MLVGERNNMPILDIKSYVKQEKEKIAATVASMPPVTLLIMQVGDNPASNSYIKGKMNDCREVGIEAVLLKGEDKHIFKGQSNIISKMNDFSGIILQLPVEDEQLKKELLNCICKYQDVDGFLPSSPFAPCTPAGIIDYLENGLNIDLCGKVVTVIGKGELVGKPLLPLLMEKGSTIISCNSKTKDLQKMVENADIVITATGVPNLIKADWIKSGQIVLDAGTGLDENGKLCGDVEKALYTSNDCWVSSVPGGVGLLTRLQLLKNTVEAAKRK